MFLKIATCALLVRSRMPFAGWLTGSLAELLGGGTMYKQLAAGPGIILAFAVLITVASIVPVYKVAWGGRAGWEANIWGWMDGRWVDGWTNGCITEWMGG